MTKPHNIRAYLATAVTAAVLSAGVTLASVSTANAASAAQTVTQAGPVQSGSFTKSSYHINGSWEILKSGGDTVLRLSDDFHTKNGPDLKLFLSPKTIGNLTGKTAQDDAVRVSVLRSNRGAQDYVIPADVDLSQFKSVIIQCEAYSVLWGGADIQAAS